MAEWIDRIPQRQPYTGFEFFCDYGKQFQENIGIHSSQLHFYRVSDGSCYNEDMSAAFQDKTVQAPGRDGTFYFGTNYTSRTFNIQIAFDSMTEDDIHEFRRIFAAKQEGDLIFDETPYKQYHVKIQSPPQIKYIVFEDVNDDDGSTKITHTTDLGSNGVSDESWCQNGRTYKGEGTIQFVAYYPFAIERYGRYKYLTSYCNNTSNNLLPSTYYSPDVHKSYEITYEVDKTDSGDSNTTTYGNINISGLKQPAEKQSSFLITKVNTIELKKNVTYYINTTYTNDFRHHLDTKDSTGYKILAKGEGTLTSGVWASYRPAKNMLAYDCIVVNQSTTTLNATFFPVLTTTPLQFPPEGTIETNTYLTWLHEHYSLNASPTNPKSWAFDFNTWKNGSNMKLSQYHQDIIASEVAEWSPIIYDKATKITDPNKQIYPNNGVIRQGATAIKVFNAGEADSDIMFYTVINATGTTRVRSGQIDLVKQVKSEENSESLVGISHRIIETIKLSSDFIKLNTQDQVLRFNSKTNLIEGGYWEANENGGYTFEPTGSIYNRFITSGNFFKIPAWELNTNYFIVSYPASEISGDATNVSRLSLSDSVQYHHVWY